MTDPNPVLQALRATRARGSSYLSFERDLYAHARYWATTRATPDEYWRARHIVGRLTNLELAAKKLTPIFNEQETP